MVIGVDDNSQCSDPCYGRHYSINPNGLGLLLILLNVAHAVRQKAAPGEAPVAEVWNSWMVWLPRAGQERAPEVSLHVFGHATCCLVVKNSPITPTIAMTTSSSASSPVLTTAPDWENKNAYPLL
jgi:hypothetical protein